MRKHGLWRYVYVALFAVLAMCAVGAGTAMAETSSSQHYQVTETQFNSGSIQSCSGQYCSQATLGDTSSVTKSSQAAFAATPESVPVLQMIVESGPSNLGILNTETTATKTTTVKIYSYLSDGYVLQVVGDPPKFQGHTLNALTTPTFSTTGMEQFGINAVLNDAPSVGADPVQVPSNSGTFGVVNQDYNTKNKFKYISGDVVAHSLTESGETDYTLSMMINIASNTPAGKYSGDFAAVVIPLY